MSTDKHRLPHRFFYVLRESVKRICVHLRNPWCEKTDTDYVSNLFKVQILA